MNIHEHWPESKRVCNQSFASSMHFAVATLDSQQRGHSQMGARECGLAARVLLAGTVMVAGGFGCREPKQPPPEAPGAPHRGNVAAKVPPPKCGVIHPDKPPPRSLHRLGGKPFKELAKHNLVFPARTIFEQLSDPVWFRCRPPKQAVTHVRWLVDKGFVSHGQPPPDLRPRIARVRQGVEVSKGGSTFYVPLPGPPQVIFDGWINGGRSLVLLQPRRIGTSTLRGTIEETIPTLLFVEKLNQPKPVVLKVPLGRSSVLASAPEAKVFYLATGPIPAPDVVYRVDPFRGTYSKVVGTKKLRCDVRCWFLHQEQLLIENPTHEDFVILFDLKGKRERLLRLPDKSSRALVIRRPGKRTLLAVGDHLIDPVRARIIGKLPLHQSSCASVFDTKRDLLYYAATYGEDCTTIQAYDVAKRRLIGTVKLKSLPNTYLRHGPPPEVHFLFLLPDGTVMAIQS